MTICHTIVLLLIVISFMTISNALSQQKEPRTLQDVGFVLPEKTTKPIAELSDIALESTVDPEKYFVGPSDIIAVNIWLSPPLNFALTVTPEGTLIIPTVGEVMVADVTLAQVKEKIISEVRKKYLTAPITATLIKPRQVVVNVVGQVLHPGLYTLRAVDRVDRAIDEANKLSRMETEEHLRLVEDQMSLRHIALKRRDGTYHRVDISKYLAIKDDRHNPYLREGDVITVTRKDRLKNVFAVYGAVNLNGKHEFVEGDSLLDAIRIAQGLTPQAVMDSILFSRLNEEATALSNSYINLKDIMEGRQPDIALQPGDRIIVKSRIEERGDYNVDLRGEVLYPGTYPITKNRTWLSEIIQQAGGFTEYASLKSAEVIRHSFFLEGMENERLLSMRVGTSPDDSIDYYQETTIRIQRANVSVDFEKLFAQKDTTQDIILQAEDDVIIPSLRQTVYVFGQVTIPGHVPFIQGRDVDYYIRKAGSFTDNARRGDVTIIKSKTKQWLDPDQTAIEDGDYVWVPRKPDRPFSYYMTIASQAASALSVVIGVAVVIVQVTK